jgi:DNA-binding winged helix-turn-helix (wHTH) protein
MALIAFADVCLDPNSLTLRGDHCEVAITVLEYRLLVVLLRRPGWQASKSEVAQEGWGHTMVNNGDAYRNCARRLNKTFVGVGSSLKITQREDLFVLGVTLPPVDI